MPLQCSNFNAFLLANDPDTRDGLLANARCKQWNCDYCAQVNRAQWRLRIYRAAEILEIEQWSFITLTAHGKARGEGESLGNLRAHWDALLKRMRRQFGGFPYVRVYEQHADGRYHLHALLGFHFPELKTRTARSGPRAGDAVQYAPLIDDYVRRVVRDRHGRLKRGPDGTLLKAPLPRGAARGLGWYHHAENLEHAAGAAKYVTKYMTKGRTKMARNIRRIQASQGFPKLPEGEGDLHWYAMSQITERDAWQYWRDGGDIIWISQKRALTADDFENGPMLPNAEEKKAGEG